MGKIMLVGLSVCVSVLAGCEENAADCNVTKAAGSYSGESHQQLVGGFQSVTGTCPGLVTTPETAEGMLYENTQHAEGYE